MTSWVNWDQYFHRISLPLYPSGIPKYEQTPRREEELIQAVQRMFNDINSRQINK